MYKTGHFCVSNGTISSKSEFVNNYFSCRFYKNFTKKLLIEYSQFSDKY